MYRGRDEELRIYDAKKRFYLLKAEELEEMKKSYEELLRDPQMPKTSLVKIREDLDRQEAEIDSLKGDVIAARKQIEDRLRRLDRQSCEVLYLKYIKQLSVNEICGKLCYSMQRIYQLLNKGVDLYRSKYSEIPLRDEKCL